MKNYIAIANTGLNSARWNNIHFLNSKCEVLAFMRSKSHEGSCETAWQP